MTEITETDANRLSADDARTLLCWRDNTREDLVIGFTMGGLLHLYHASERYLTLEAWLDESPGTLKRYNDAMQETTYRTSHPALSAA